MNASLDKLLEYELFPVGEFETLKVNVTKKIPFANYPNVCKVIDVDNPHALYKEFLDFRKKVNHSSNHYVKERLRYFKINPKDWSVYFESLGFNSKQYETYSMRDLGTAILKAEVGDLTRKTLSQIGCPLFRQQYAIAHPGWETQFHVDTNRLDLHGFRVMIPLNCPFEIEFEDESYVLQPGAGYFVNVTKPHKGLNTSSQIRCNIMVHTTTDSIIHF